MYTPIELLSFAARAWDNEDMAIYWILIDNYAAHVRVWN